VTAENQPQPAADQEAADRESAERRDAGQQAAAVTLAQTRAAEDDAIAQRRLEEDQELADKRTGEDRQLDSAAHRLFLSAAAMTAAVNAGDIAQVRGANGELQAAIQAHLDLSKPE
jgi:hypothetical protein